MSYAKQNFVNGQKLTATHMNHIEKGIVDLEKSMEDGDFNGSDGVSPTITVATITGGHRITITDATGTKSVDVMNGTDGAKGDKGDKGDPGEQGIQGEPGEDGRGIVSITRTAGSGAAGTTDTYTITYTDNTTSNFTVYNGANGKDGTDGISGGKADFVVQDTPPEDTSVLWIDPTDNSIDEIPENSGGKSVISYSSPAEVPLENGSQYVFYGATGGTISLEIGSDESGKVEYEVSSGFDVIWLLWMQTSDVQGSLIETSGTRKSVSLSGDFSKIKISSTTTYWVVVKIG